MREPTSESLVTVEATIGVTRLASMIILLNGLSVVRQTVLTRPRKETIHDCINHGARHILDGKRNKDEDYRHPQTCDVDIENSKSADEQCWGDPADYAGGIEDSNLLSRLEGIQCDVKVQTV
jgi:hypothetical protein